MLVLDCCDQLFAQTVGRPQPEKLLRLVEDVDGSRLRAGKLGCLGDDRGQHGLEIESGVDRVADLAERLQLFDRLREFAGARLPLVEQPHVLDRDPRLIGEGLGQLNLLFVERSDGGALHAEQANGDALSQEGHYEDCAKAA